MKALRPVAGCLIFLLVWHVAALEASAILPTPTAVIESLARLGAEGRLARDTAASLLRVSAGVAIAVLASLVMCGIALLSPASADVLSGPLEIARPVPPIAWVPVAIMVFGVSDGAAVSIVAAGAFFPIWISSMSGIAGIRRAHVLAARSLGARHWQLMLGVLVPSALPSALQGLRLGVGMGWFSVVAAEMMGAPGGLGQGIQLFSMNLQLARLYGYIAVVGCIGYILNALLLHVHRHATRWEHTERWRHE